jgi:hypothetical protein
MHGLLKDSQTNIECASRVIFFYEIFSILFKILELQLFRG